MNVHRLDAERVENLHELRRVERRAGDEADTLALDVGKAVDIHPRGGDRDEEVGAQQGDHARARGQRIVEPDDREVDPPCASRRLCCWWTSAAGITSSLTPARVTSSMRLNAVISFASDLPAGPRPPADAAASTPVDHAGGAGRHERHQRCDDQQETRD